MKIQKVPDSVTLSVTTAAQPGSVKRLLFIDNLRWLMIVLVVLIHLNVTYGNIGGWYYFEKGALDSVSKIIFTMFGSFTQAYFMGFLFFIAGYFIPGSFERKGAARYIGERFVRLGIPTVVYMLLLHPLTILIIWISHQAVPTHLSEVYLKYLTSFEFVGSTGPLWFAFALLIFSLFYTVMLFFWMKFSKVFPKPNDLSVTHFKAWMIVTLLTVATFLVRLVQPIGTGFYNMQLCFFPQYIILFSLGLFAYRYHWLSKISYSFGMTWFKIALFWGIPIWVVILLAGGALQDINPYYGGIHWQAAAYAFWESLFCIGICLGLLVLFREKYSNQGRISHFLSDNAFAVYVFHAPLLVAITMILRGVVMYPLLKMLLAAMLVLPVCFGFAYLIRKIPLIKKLFS